MTLALRPVEIRVLGCLIEKERATPQGYPLTGNSLRLACNQSSNRHPVVDYDERLIETTVAGLKEQGLLRFVYSPSNRATKYRHVLDEALHLADDELAVLCVLFLRGAQTVGEIKGRTERLHPFVDLAAVETTLDRLADRQPDPFVRRLARQPGQKDARWVHLLGDGDPAADVEEPGVVDASASPRHQPVASASIAAAAPRVDALEQVTVELRAELDELRGQLTELRTELTELRHQLGD